MTVDVKAKLHCSFCGKGQDDLAMMISAPSALDTIICNECIAVCVRVMSDQLNRAIVTEIPNAATRKQQDAAA